jgi:arylsulfatase
MDEWQNGQAAYHNSFKIVKHGLDKPFELYNLTTDPTETNNLATENPEKAGELEKMFLEWKTGLPKF